MYNIFLETRQLASSDRASRRRVEALWHAGVWARALSFSPRPTRLACSSQLLCSFSVHTILGSYSSSLSATALTPPASRAPASSLTKQPLFTVSGSSKRLSSVVAGQYSSIESCTAAGTANGKADRSSLGNDPGSSHAAFHLPRLEALKMVLFAFGDFDWVSWSAPLLCYSSAARCEGSTAHSRSIGRLTDVDALLFLSHDHRTFALALYHSLACIGLQGCAIAAHLQPLLPSIARQ